MARTCHHKDEASPVAGCRVCELWSECPEYYAMWEGLEAPPLPDIVKQLRQQNPHTLWRDPALVKRMAEAHQRQLPGLLTMAKNLAIATAKHVANGGKTVSEEEKEARLSQCRTCVHFQATTGRCTHNKCGCFVNVKTAWESEHCPVGRW